MPPPKGSMNALRHGLTASRLPPRCGWIRNTLLELRRQLEAECLEAHGAVNIEQASLILNAVDWTRHSLLMQRWLREEAETMSATDRALYSKEIARAGSERTRAIKALRLGDGGKILSIYATPRLPDDGGFDGGETEAEAG